jgi:hypothetical protein
MIEFSRVTGLAEAGYIVKQKNGRRTRYQVQAPSRCPNPLPRNPPSAKSPPSSRAPTPGCS